MQKATAKGNDSHCRIVEIVIASKARKIVVAFREGSSTRSLSRVYGVSRTGVEELIRSYGWRR